MWLSIPVIIILVGLVFTLGAYYHKEHPEDFDDEDDDEPLLPDYPTI